MKILEKFFDKLAWIGSSARTDEQAKNFEKSSSNMHIFNLEIERLTANSEATKKISDCLDVQHFNVYSGAFQHRRTQLTLCFPNRLQLKKAGL